MFLGGNFKVWARGSLRALLLWKNTRDLIFNVAQRSTGVSQPLAFHPSDDARYFNKRPVSQARYLWCRSQML